jgi:hypothetical protein
MLPVIGSLVMGTLSVALFVVTTRLGRPRVTPGK